MLYLPTGPPPSLVQGQEPGSLLQMATLSTPRPSSSKSQLSCLPSRGGDRGEGTSPNNHTYTVPTQVPTETVWQLE